MLDWQFKTRVLRPLSRVQPLDNAAQQMQQVMNDEALKGWEFVQALHSDGGYILIFRKQGSVGLGYADR